MIQIIRNKRHNKIILRRLLFFNITLVLLLANSPLARAQLANPDLPYREGVKIKDVIIHSAIKTEEQFEGNIYLQDTDTKSDSITLVNPSVGIEIPLRRNRISADYDAEIYSYGSHESEDHVDHRVRALGEVNLADYKVSARDTVRIFIDRRADENSNRIKRQENTFRIGIEAKYERLGFDIGYTNKFEGYDSEEISFRSLTYSDRSRFVNIIDATLSYRFLPKTMALLENDLGFVTYHNSSEVPNSYYDEILLGMRGEWFAKLYINFKAGLRYQNYEDSNLIVDKDYVGLVMRGGLDYFATEDDTVTLAAERVVVESIYSNMNYYNVNALKLSYTHRFNDKVSATLFGIYQLNLYPAESTENNVTGKRYDNYLWGGASLRYDIRKWLSVEAKYEYRQRISRFDIFDYIDNLATLRGTVGF
ncbi:MAG: hypothetical protein A2987_04345 [Omnitrophica bacterium RIFCSPLOWO2_01_FULL_45_10]|nr:MAG: hypothetical protein A2987_04345 [Omnitrophica bacterium RIFCSPLOWO2_01_FULL_45_10]